MRVIIGLLTLLGSTAACGPSHLYVEAEYSLQVAEFVKAAQARNTEVQMVPLQVYTVDEIKDVPDTVVAVCGHHNREIRVKRGQWAKLNKKQREEVILHELGHCVLNRKEHDEGVRANGKPKSIMYKRVFEIDDEDREYYLDELFEGRKDEN
jgi:hypothetical protein